MKLTLAYRGLLPAQRRSIAVTPVKAALRKAFHPQIRDQVKPRLGDITIAELISDRTDHMFVSPASRRLRTAVELEVLMLVPNHSSRPGDIDNRLKTLVDGLTAPANKQQLAGFSPPEPGEPTYCLMEDDRLVRRIAIDSRPWYDPTASAQEVFVVVTATIVLGSNTDLQSPTANIFLVL